MKRRHGLLRCLAAFLCAALLTPGVALAAPEGSTVWGYSEGLALCEQGGKWGYVNSQKNVVIPIQFDSAVSFSLGIAAVNLGGKLGVIRQDGAYLIPVEYGTLVPVDCGLYLAQKGSKWGVVSVEALPDGRGGATHLLYDVIYDSAEIIEQGGAQVISLTKGNDKTVIPVFDLTAQLLKKGAPSGHFPLSRGKLPSFSDVTPKDWYALWVDIAYNVGLASGIGNNQFGPGNTLTVAEALKLAATMDSRFKDDDFHLQRPPTSGAWYRPAVDYCLASGIITAGEFSEQDYTRPATRSEMARIFGATTLAKDMPALNSLTQVKRSVPDVTSATPNADAIYQMYAKGILSGVDGRHTFKPNNTITRAEVAAIVSRMARAEQRLTLF